jgi:predicted DNA-binding transcriptional regulator YafY
MESRFREPLRLDIDKHSRRAFGAFQNDSEYGEVVWKFKPAVASHARAFLFHPTQVLEDLPDGSLIVRFSASGYLEMCWHLYTWGDQVEVLAPPALRKMVEPYRRSDLSALLSSMATLAAVRRPTSRENIPKKHSPGN